MKVNPIYQAAIAQIVEQQKVVDKTKAVYIKENNALKDLYKTAAQYAPDEATRELLKKGKLPSGFEQ